MKILMLFPSVMRSALLAGCDALGATPEEIRLQIGSPVRLRAYGNEVICCEAVTKEQMLIVVGNAGDGSYHTAAQHIQNGFIPLKGGCRMGVCGNGVNGRLSSFRDISSVCIRIASEAIGCADKLYEVLYGSGRSNTIIVAPPGAGKTTLLRELIRKLSYSGVYVGVADERGEIAGMYGELPSFDLGPRCHVQSGLPKSQAAMMLLRSMAPQVIAMDEITAYSDAAAILEAVGCGVGLLTTTHGDGLLSLRKPAFRALYDAMVFEKAVLVHVERGERVYQVVDLYDEAMWRINDCCGGRSAGIYSVTGNEASYPSAVNL